ncbi:MAG: rRNA maturation RNase YbeY [Methylovulum sp.]|nr:MAG: rRNA maturation RNase YbeY [Methylovulum sp.]
MNYLDIQTISSSDGQPTLAQFQHWVDAALDDMLDDINQQDTEIVIRIVDEQESAELNEQYRNKHGATNILSFPFEAPDIAGIEFDLLGDLVICAPVLEREAQQQNKTLADHWAHIVVHGVLHLRGYDHINDDDADIMEHKEIIILQQLNINNPYTGT